MSNKRLQPHAIKALQEVKQAILARPENFDMGHWIGGMDDDDALMSPEIATSLETGEHCGTTACIAGWICALNNLTTMHPGYAASTFLGLGIDSARLFYTSNWPVDLRKHYKEAEFEGDTLAQAQIAAEAIDRFIEGDGSFD